MKKLQQYSILKLNMSNFKKNNGTYEIDVTTKYFRKSKTIGKESELFRIVNHLRKYGVNIEDQIDNNKKYPLMQDLLVVHINKGTKQYYENSSGILTVKYKSKENLEATITYKRLLASSGHVRNKKIFYINEKLYIDALEILLCGMPNNSKFKVLAKFNSHFGLCSTDGIPVEMPNILVIPDFEHRIEESFDVVDEYEQDKYKVIPNQKRKVLIKPHDGAGLVDVRRVIKWCRNKEELDLHYIPSSLLIRTLPGIKGNLYTVDLKKYIQEKGQKNKEGKITRVDVWGNEITLMDEQGNLLIDCVLTASQVKFHDKYDSFDQWYDAFCQEHMGYKRTFNICQWSENPKYLKNKVPLSYQPLQSLELSEDDIKSVCQETIDTIKNISTNVVEFIKFRGINTKDKEKLKALPEYYRILKSNKYLFYDPWFQKKIQEDIDGIKKRAYLGGIFVQGNYQVLGIDVVSLLEWTLNLPVTGVLKANEIYSKYWLKKEINEVALVRFPHVSHEWKISNVTKPNNPDVEYFKYQRSTICISIHDSTDMRLGGADHDNDHVISLSNKVLIQAAKHSKDNKNTVYPEESWKDKQTDKEKKSPKEYSIDNMKGLIKTDCDGMTMNIGHYVNKITKLWSMEQTPEIKDHIKIMSVICSKVIDFAKTGIKAKIPEDIQEVLDKDDRLPYFMQYRYPGKITKQNRVNSNLAYIGSEEKEESFIDTDCTMDRICKYLKNNVKNIKLETPKDRFDHSKFYKNKPDKYHNVYYKKVLKKLKGLKKEHDTYLSSDDYLNKDEKIENVNQYRLFYEYCKNSLLEICPNIDKLIDILIFAFYEDKDFKNSNPDKAILFNCFGTRLRNRLEGKAKDIPLDNEEEYIIQKTEAKNRNKERLTKNREVKFAIYINKEKIDIVQDDSRGLTKDEIDFIKNSGTSFGARKLLLVLLLLEKSYSKHNSDFKIYYGTKDETKVTKTSLYRDLAEINHKQYDKYLKQFKEKNIINLNISNNKSYLICKVNCESEGENIILINNLNKIKENFKIIK